MTQDEILTMALEVSGAEINGYRYGPNGREPLYGVPIETEDGFEYEPFKPPSWLSAFAALVAEREREACTKVCEDIEDEYQRTEGMRCPELKSDAQTGASDCAAAIRARSSHG